MACAGSGLGLLVLTWKVKVGELRKKGLDEWAEVLHECQDTL